MPRLVRPGCPKHCWGVVPESTVPLAAINRVGELLPGVSGKTVVYGGAESRFRSDCEVVALSGLAGVIERSESSRQ